MTFADLPWQIVFVIAAFGPICGMAFHPAESSLLPALARTPEELTAANVSSSTIESVGAFAGPAVGGIVLASLGVGAAFVLTSVTYLWSAAMIMRLRVERDAPLAAEEETLTHEGFLAGFRAIAATKGLRLIVLLYAAQTVVAGAMGVLVVVSALRLLSLGNGGVGWLYSACGIGGVIGAVVALALVGRQRLASDFGIGLLLWGVPFLVLGLWPNTVVALVMLGVLGIGNTLVDVSALTLLQRNTDERVRARVFGVIESTTTGTIGLGAVLAPLMIALFGIRPTLIVTGLFLPIVTGLLWRRLLALNAPPPTERLLELLQAIPIFAPLPPADLERLAQALQPLKLAAGSTLFAVGDVGDHFYIVDSGELGIDLPTGQKVERPGRLGGGDRLAARHPAHGQCARVERCAAALTRARGVPRSGHRSRPRLAGRHLYRRRAACLVARLDRTSRTGPPSRSAGPFWPRSPSGPARRGRRPRDGRR